MVTAHSCSSLGGEETTSCFFLLGGHGDQGTRVERIVHSSRLDICRLSVRLFFFLGQDSTLLNGGSDLSVLNDRSPCVGKSPSQRVGAFTC